MTLPLSSHLETSPLAFPLPSPPVWPPHSSTTSHSPSHSPTTTTARRLPRLPRCRPLHRLAHTRGSLLLFLADAHATECLRSHLYEACTSEGWATLPRWMRVLLLSPSPRTHMSWWWWWARRDEERASRWGHDSTRPRWYTTKEEETMGAGGRVETREDSPTVCGGGWARRSGVSSLPAWTMRHRRGQEGERMEGRRRSWEGTSRPAPRGICVMVMAVVVVVVPHAPLVDATDVLVKKVFLIGVGGAKMGWTRRRRMGERDDHTDSEMEGETHQEEQEEEHQTTTKEHQTRVPCDYFPVVPPVVVARRRPHER